MDALNVALEFTQNDLTRFLKEATAYAQSKGADRATLNVLYEQMTSLHEEALDVPKNCEDPNVISGWGSEQKVRQVQAFKKLHLEMVARIIPLVSDKSKNFWKNQDIRPIAMTGIQKDFWWLVREELRTSMDKEERNELVKWLQQHLPRKFLNPNSNFSKTAIENEEEYNKLCMIKKPSQTEQTRLIELYDILKVNGRITTLPKNIPAFMLVPNAPKICVAQFDGITICQNYRRPHSNPSSALVLHSQEKWKTKC